MRFINKNGVWETNK